MEKILYREGFTAEELPNEVIERIKGVSYKESLCEAGRPCLSSCEIL